ncbi:hypothetical protein PHISCL_08448, partial [Aspergillus sclerotialis]
PPDLTTSVGFESSTTSTSLKLPPIDPQILLGDKDQPVGLGKYKLELNRSGEVNELGFYKLSTDMQTESVHTNTILQTPTTEDQEKSQTLSASDSVESSFKTYPSSSAGDQVPRRAGPITRTRK